MIEIGRKGKILQGRKIGNYVIIQDDIENTGGYLILTSPESDFLQGFDDWVEKEDLEAYVKESNWEIEWIE